MKKKKVIYLESVGTALDQDGYTYPMLAKGGYDQDEGVKTHVSDCCDEWYQTLSVADLDLIINSKYN